MLVQIMRKPFMANSSGMYDLRCHLRKHIASLIQLRMQYLAQKEHEEVIRHLGVPGKKDIVWDSQSEASGGIERYLMNTLIQVSLLI